MQHVVVLGTGYCPRPGMPVTGALEGEGVIRLVEGLRLVRQSGASGGARRGDAPTAQGYALLATQLGFDPASLTLLDQPLDTG